MKKGFFGEYEDLLGRLNINNNCLDVTQYLYGRCDEFALALNKMFGYAIILWLDYIEKKEVLVHAFNVLEKEGKRYYVDVRGITDNIEDITSSFDYYEDPEFKEYSLDESQKILSNILNTDILISDEIFDIINIYADNYTLQC